MSAGGLVLGDEAGAPRAKDAGAAGPVKLIAMADLRPDRIQQAHGALSKLLGDRIDVPPERRFLGFEAYRKAIDCLRPGDVAMLTTHAAFRAPTWSMRSRRASTCSWRRISRPIRAASSG